MEVIHSELPEELTNNFLEKLKSLEKWDTILIVKDGLPFFHVRKVNESNTETSAREPLEDTQYTQAMLATSLIQVVRELSRYETEKTRMRTMEAMTDDQHEMITLLKGLKTTTGTKTTELLIYESKKPSFCIIITRETRRFVLDPKTAVDNYASFLKEVKEKMISEGILSD